MRPLGLILLCVFAGCDASLERFPPNEVFALTLAKSRDAQTSLATKHATEVTTALFGTPAAPLWPADLLDESKANVLIDPASLIASAGPVYSDREGNNFGLFNKHCVVCHGLSGSGAGPAAVFQNPYPRDFRRGVFKWKSTTRNAKPTREDLVGLLHRGVPGTGMPSFALIDEKDTAALIDYLVFLTVRGETERELLAFAVDELGYDDEYGEPDQRLAANWAKDSSPESLAANTDVRQIVQQVVGTWTNAEKTVVPVPLETTNDSESISRGKDLFHGQIANCVGCHGPAGNGSAITMDFDDWAKEYSTRIGLTPTDREAMKPFRQAGALRPRQIKPRQLNQGVFHGAGDSPALYRQVSQGIAGTPMPSLTITDQPSKTGLTSDQAWDLVHYVQSLSGKASDQVSKSEAGR